MKKIIISIALLTLICVNFSFSQSLYHVVNKISIPGNGGWDYISVDEPTSTLFVSHGNEMDVIDLNDNNKLIAIVKDLKGMHGITFVKDLDMGYISNGRDTSVTVIDLETYEFVKKIKVTGLNPDAILYDPFSNKVFTFNGGSSNATVIDVNELKVVGTIKLPGKPEFAVTDKKGKVYVNIENKNSICVIDVNTLKVEKIWSIQAGKTPGGLAIDIENHRLFSVCDNKLMVVVDAETGKVITTVKIGKDVDGVAYDTVLKRIFVSCGEGTMTVIQQNDANNYSVLENVTTQKRACTIALNSKTHTLYLPTAEYNPAPKPKPKNLKPQATVKPGSFTVLEVGLK
jgi:DNA-binding beta-propeller fold protein YncE